MEIGFQGQYDKNQYFKAVMLAGQPSRRSLILRAVLVIIFGGLYIAYVSSLFAKENMSTSDIARTLRHLITFLILLYFLLQPYISSYLTASRLWKDMAGIRIAGVITGQGITFTSPDVGYETKWESFARLRETENMMVLLTADGMLSAFPRHFFKSDEDWTRFKQWIASRVQEPK